MTATEATGDVFLMALKALPKAQRDAVLVGIARDKSLAYDLMDLMTIARRRRERSCPFRKYLAERGKS